MRILTLPTCLFALGLGACASVPQSGNGTATPETADDTPPIVPAYAETANAAFGAIRAAQDPRERDRRAILAMAGEYRVTFDFVETVELKDGYERQAEKESGGYETVIVVNDSPERIVLQHLLVAPSGHVTKHWRQDWVFEAGERFEFVANQTWRSEPLPEEATTGAWTQCVFEVSDAPRYCGTGRWRHEYGVSTWTSDRSWRPLPRREYTRRDDYNALNVENRHTITPGGWTHEQDNTKVVRDGETTVETLTREFGFNDYRSIEGYDFSPAYTYWEKTADYWALVRDAWDDRLEAGKTLTLDTTVDGMVIIAGTFAQAEASEETSEAEEQEAIETLLDEWTSVKPNRVAARPTR